MLNQPKINVSREDFGQRSTMYLWDVTGKISGVIAREARELARPQGDHEIFQVYQEHIDAAISWLIDHPEEFRQKLREAGWHDPKGE